MPGLFISYRRSDSAGWAGRLKDHLEVRFGRAMVWQDVDDIQPGELWHEKILSAVRSADAVLVIIGPRWVEVGALRWSDGNDVLTEEVESALASRATIIPVLVGGAAMPAERDLPPSLRALTGRQGVTLLDTDWHRGVQLLVETLRDMLAGRDDHLPLQALFDELIPLQTRFFELLVADPQQALAIAARALSILDRGLPHYPQDTTLQLFRAYFEKDQAQALRMLGDATGADEALARAQRGFSTMRDELESQMANVYNGIGSVLAERQDLRGALKFIEQALALRPDYEAAKHDRDVILDELRVRRPRRGGSSNVRPRKAKSRGSKK